MEWTYPLERVGGHLLLSVDGTRRGLIDTGAPASMKADDVEVSVAGVAIEARAGDHGHDLGWIGEQVGAKLDFLLGMDVIGRRSLVVDIGRGTVVLGDGPLALEGAAATVGSLFTVPTVEVEVGGRKVQAVFDTGAQLGYGEPTFLEGLESVGESQDFHPHGRTVFWTPLYEIPVTLAGVTRTVHMGRLPDALRALMPFWILGPGFFASGAFGLDMRAGRLVVGG